MTTLSQTEIDQLTAMRAQAQADATRGIKSSVLIYSFSDSSQSWGGLSERKGDKFAQHLRPV